MDDSIKWLIALCVVAIGMMFVGEWTFQFDDRGEIGELAQSICDQEYNMDYDSYDDGEITCKPKVITEQEQYDGIVINIKEVR